MLCDFDSDKRCKRCGFVASSLPLYRNCQTIEEMARARLSAFAGGRIKVPAIPIGTGIASALSAIGISEERVKKIIGKDCGCKARASRLDKAGAAISKAIERIANKAASAVIPYEITEDDVATLAKAIYDSPATNEGLKEQAKNGHRPD
jgi:hypothetical protein